MRSADTELQNTIELRAKALEIAAPQPDLDAKGKKNTILKPFLKRVLKGKWSAPKSETSRDKITLADLMQPFQYNSRWPAAKDNSIAHAAVAPSNLDAAITMRSADTELQNT